MRKTDLLYLSIRTFARTLRFSAASLFIMTAMTFVCSLLINIGFCYFGIVEGAVGWKVVAVLLVLLLVNVALAIGLTFGSLANSLRISTLKNERLWGLCLALGAEERDLDRLRINQVTLLFLMSAALTFGLSYGLAPYLETGINYLISLAHLSTHFVFYWWINLGFSFAYGVVIHFYMQKKVRSLHWMAPAEALKEIQ